MIRLGRESESENPLIELLKVVLSDNIGSEEKVRILQDKYAIDVSEELEMEMVEMCNLSDLVEERGEERGIAIVYGK